MSPRYRRLTTDFRYIDPVEGIIRCKKGLEIDGASFGRAFSVFFGDQHDYDVPATPHDQLYEDNRVAGQYLTAISATRFSIGQCSTLDSPRRLPGLFMPASDWVAGGHGGEIVAEMRKSGRRNRYEKTANLAGTF